LFDEIYDLYDHKAGDWPAEVVQRVGGSGGIAQTCLDHQPRCRASVQDVLPALQALKQEFASTYTPPRFLSERHVQRRPMGNDSNSVDLD
jgi:hypothetical protein